MGWDYGNTFILNELLLCVGSGCGNIWRDLVATVGGTNHAHKSHKEPLCCVFVSLETSLICEGETENGCLW